MATISIKQLDAKTLTGPVSVISKTTSSSHEQRLFDTAPLPHRRDYYLCTDCGAYSCGGIYSSLCTICDGVSADPPRDVRRQYLCIECARRRFTCNCDRHSSPIRIFREPPKYCWCRRCTCCTYSCSCSCSRFFCECLSAPCKRYETCCYCTRRCCPNDVCCKTRFCFWSWRPCACDRPPPPTSSQ